MESIFNNPTLSDLTLILKNKENEERFYCHKSILANKSQYFRSMLLNFNESKKDLIIIETDSIEEDTLIIRLLYENIKLPQDNIKQKILFLLRSDFYGVNFVENIEQYFSEVMPTDIQILVEHFDILPQISNILIKYISLFIIDIPNIDEILDQLYIVNKQIVYNIIDTLFEKTCLCSSRRRFQQYFGKSFSRVKVERMGFTNNHPKYISNIQYLIPNKLYHRNIFPYEESRYYHLPNIQAYVVFWMPYVGIARLMFEYQYFDSMDKINFTAFDERMKKDAFGRCNNLDFIKKIHNVDLISC